MLLTAPWYRMSPIPASLSQRSSLPGAAAVKQPMQESDRCLLRKQCSCRCLPRHTPYMLLLQQQFSAAHVL
jgi:hypothetical protein